MRHKLTRLNNLTATSVLLSAILAASSALSQTSNIYVTLQDQTIDGFGASDAQEGCLSECYFALTPAEAQLFFDPNPTSHSAGLSFLRSWVTDDGSCSSVNYN